MMRVAPVLIAGVGLFVSVLLNTAWGAASGFILASLVPDTISGGFAAVGLTVNPDQFYKLGAALGWVGGFVRVISPPDGKRCHA